MLVNDPHDALLYKCFILQYHNTGEKKGEMRWNQRNSVLQLEEALSSLDSLGSAGSAEASSQPGAVRP